MNHTNSDLAVEIVRVRVLPDGRMNRANAAVYLDKKPKTLAMWEMQGKGPRSVLIGGRRYYYKSELDAYLDRARYEIRGAT